MPHRLAVATDQMAQDQNKSEEEKFELTETGESLGYITLEQARVLALEHARDYLHPGRRVWTVEVAHVLDGSEPE